MPILSSKDQAILAYPPDAEKGKVAKDQPWSLLIEKATIGNGKLSEVNNTAGSFLRYIHTWRILVVSS